MDLSILTIPSRAPIGHAGFSQFVNDSPYAHPWHRCCHGHYQILEQRNRPIVVLEDDVMLSPDFNDRLSVAASIFDDNIPYIVHLYAGVKYEVFPVEKRPFELPPEVQDWGTQAIYYNPAARKICADLCSAYLRAPVNRTGTERHGVRHGFDCYLFPTLRMLGIKVFYYAAVQHMVMPSTCLSPVHWSPYFPAPSEFPLPGWW